MKKAWDVLIPALILLIALAIRWIDPLPVEYLRNVTFDSYQRLKPRIYNPDLPVRIATIDEKSLKLFGQWPWPRSRMAQIIDRLAELGAAVVGVDILFAEPDRTSPEAVMNQLPDTPALRTARQALAQMPDNDAVFADALRKVPVVLAFALQNADPHRPQEKPAPIGGFVFLGDDPRQFVTSYPYVVLPLANLRAAAAGIGVVNAVPDIDGIIRRIPLVQLYRDQLVPSLVAEALRLAGGGPSYLLRSAKTTSEGIGSLLGQGVGAMRIGSQFTVTTTGSAEMLLYDTGTKPQRFFSIADLMDPAFDRSQVEGRVILVGSTVEGLKDSKPSPITRDMSGVEFHAQTIEQVLATNLLGEPQLTRPYWAFGAELLYLALTGILTIFILRRRGALTGLLLAVNVLAVALAGSWYLFSRQHVLIDPIYPGLVVFLIFVAGTLANFVRTESEKRHVRNAFSLYLSPVMVDQLSQNPQRLSLGGETRNLTVMFCDVRGFTKISENLDPQSLTQLMNRFLTPMTRSIQAHQGTIDKYIGDCVMAFWNAPLDVPQHGRQALMAAFEMRRALHHLNLTLKAEAEHGGKSVVELQIGIGLNSGPGCVGNMGSEQRLTYSVLGDTVNIASRLEALSPRYGVDLVIGEETAEAAPDFALLELDQVRVKGKQEPVRIFTALGDRTIADSTEFMKVRLTHDALLTAYRNRDWPVAMAALETCREVMPAGMAAFYDLYAERLAEFQHRPPAPDWDGVYIARSKTG
ncbi:MAG: adenylate/guanylate cyclase domain-containing protein [Rhodospirillaceae bacterium]|nr:MAG: adenylate/guanylate cyclase domain-containing protein [Rhodospirillaceae bacterium]